MELAILLVLVSGISCREHVRHTKHSHLKDIHSSKKFNIVAHSKNEVSLLILNASNKACSYATCIDMRTTRSNLGRVASRSRLWDRYWGQNGGQLDDESPVTSHKRLRDAARPRLLLVSKVANEPLSRSRAHSTR